MRHYIFASGKNGVYEAIRHELKDRLNLFDNYPIIEDEDPISDLRYGQYWRMFTVNRRYWWETPYHWAKRVAEKHKLRVSFAFFGKYIYFWKED